MAEYPDRSIQNPPPYHQSTEHELPPPYKPDWIHMHHITTPPDTLPCQSHEGDEQIVDEVPPTCDTDPWLIPPESRDPREPVVTTVYGHVPEQQALLDISGPFQAPPSYSSLDVSLPAVSTVSTIETHPPTYLTPSSRQCSHISLVERDDTYGQVSLINTDGQPIRFGQVKKTVDSAFTVCNKTQMFVSMVAHISLVIAAYNLQRIMAGHRFTILLHGTQAETESMVWYITTLIYIPLAYLVIVIEASTCQVRKFLSSCKTVSEAKELVEKYRRLLPLITWKVLYRCQSIRGGYVLEGIDVPFQACVDISGDLEEHLQATECDGYNLVQISTLFGFLDSDSAKNYNTFRDLSTQNSLGNHFSEIWSVPGVSSEEMLMVPSAAASSGISWACPSFFWVCTCLLMTWPYRILLLLRCKVVCYELVKLVSIKTTENT